MGNNGITVSVSFTLSLNLHLSSIRNFFTVALGKEFIALIVSYVKCTFFPLSWPRNCTFSKNKAADFYTSSESQLSHSHILLGDSTFYSSFTKTPQAPLERELCQG